jgi:hypothetical protein
MPDYDDLASRAPNVEEMAVERNRAPRVGGPFTRGVIPTLIRVFAVECRHWREQRMTSRRDVHSPKPEGITAHYASGYEADIA